MGINIVFEINEQEFLKHYKKGKSTPIIARALDVGYDDLILWMMNNGYEPYFQRTSAAFDRKAIAMWRAGYTDAEIAKAVKVKTSTITGWRHRRDLVLKSYTQKADRREMYRKNVIRLTKLGYSDKQIAEEICISRVRVNRMRRDLGLPSARQQKHNIKLELYKKGLSDSEIAIEVGQHKDEIKAWRKRYNLS